MQLLKGLFNNKKEKKIIKKDHEKLKSYTMAKLDYAVQKKDEENFINVIKEFFAKMFHIKYEFTLGELTNLIKHKKIKRNIKKKLLDLLSVIDDAYYSSNKVEKGKLQQLNLELKAIIKEL